MKRMILLLALLVVASPCLGGDQDRDRQKEPQTYESPILSLLFLPANVLIKIASIFGPGTAEQPKPQPSAPKNGSSQ